MCNTVLLLFGKLPQWNLHVNCPVNGTTLQSGLRFQTGLSSLRVSCKRALSNYYTLPQLDQRQKHSIPFVGSFIIYSHKKPKDILKGSLVWVLLAAEIEFLKILVPSLTQNPWNINAESTRKSKQLYYLCGQLLGALIYLHFVVLVLTRCKLWNI